MEQTITAIEEAGRLTGRVRAIYIYPERRGPAQELREAQALSGIGLQGDQKRSPKRSLTLIGQEAWARAQAELGGDRPPTTRRANLLLAGIDLRQTIGRRLRIGAVEVQINGKRPPAA